MEKSSDWEYSPQYSSFKCKGYQLLGPYGASAMISTTLAIPGAHNGVIVGFRVAFIDSWDGEALAVTADGNVVYSLRHTSGSQSPFSSCGHEWNDYYTFVRFGFNHTAGQLNLQIFSGLDEGIANEAWGLCNLTINATSSYVDTHGNVLGTGQGGSLKPLTFNCYGPAIDTDWSYSPYYSITNCGGKNFVSFSAGGSMSATFAITEAHKSISMSFQLAFVDSWDGETFSVTADGELVYSLRHNYGESPSNTCENGWYDQYFVPTFSFNHSGDSLTITMSSNLDQYLGDEAWGVCNLIMTANTNYVDSDGEMMTTESTGVELKSMSFSCSSPEEDEDWSYYPSYDTITCDENTYVGGFGKSGQISGTFAVSETHNGIIVSFKLAFIDSWDGESFYVYADDFLVYSRSHYYYQGSSDTCQDDWNDEYISIQFGFNHSTASLTLLFNSSLDQVSADEAWGICDLVITTSTYYVDVNGNYVGSGTGGTISGLKFSCETPELDTDWSYSPYYGTFECNDQNYVGPFSAGGSISSILTVSESHEGIVLNFKLAVIDSWDEESFYVIADGIPVYLGRYNHNNFAENSCLNSYYGDEYVNVTVGFNHTGDYLTLKFGSNLDQDSLDESWGICDLTITATTYPVDTKGEALE